jgi:AcrR family transcriptional regulator
VKLVMAANEAVRVAPRRRARSARAYETDRRVLDGAASVIAGSGWKSLTVQSCAKAAGLSSKAINDRYTSVAELGVAEWRDGAGEALREHLVTVLAALLPLEAGSPVDTKAATRGLNRLSRPDAPLVVAIELMGAAVFDEMLREAIAEDLSKWLSSWCQPSKKSAAVRSAQSAYVTVVALGLLFAFRRQGADQVRIDAQVEQLAAALVRPATPSALPKVEAAQMRLDPPGPVLDSHDELLAATLLEVAQYGYPAATLVRIIASTGSTEGLVYSRYASKIELFIAAVQWRTENALHVNLNWFRDLANSIGPGLAEAVMWREYMRPAHALGRGLAIEQIRTGWREPLLQAANDAAEAKLARTLMAANPSMSRKSALSSVHWDLALGFGAELLPSFLPDAWKLPFDVVTVPLLTALDSCDLALGYVAQSQP